MLSPLPSNVCYPTHPAVTHTGSGGGAPEYLIERTGTDAAVFLTVYPYTGLEVLNVTHFTDLGNQILNCGWFQSLCCDSSLIVKLIIMTSYM
jgi:hypothetical protein